MEQFGRTLMITRPQIPIVAHRTFGRLVVMMAAAVVPINGAGLASAAPVRPATPPKAVPVIGACVDEADKPLAGVKVALYRVDYAANKHERIAERQTKADG